MVAYVYSVRNYFLYQYEVKMEFNNENEFVSVVTDNPDSGASVSDMKTVEDSSQDPSNNTVNNSNVVDNANNSNNCFYTKLQSLKNTVYDLMRYNDAKSLNNEDLAKELLVVDAILNNLFVKIEGVNNFVKDKLSN